MHRRRLLGGAHCYPDVFQQAAALMRSLAENQPLVDGNKRTAWLATVTFANLNGWNIEATAEDVVVVMLRLAAHEIGVAEIAEWLRDRARPKGD